MSVVFGIIGAYDAQIATQAHAKLSHRQSPSCEILRSEKLFFSNHHDDFSKVHLDRKILLSFKPE